MKNQQMKANYRKRKYFRKWPRKSTLEKRSMKTNGNNYKPTKSRIQDSQTINVRKEANQNARSQ